LCAIFSGIGIEKDYSGLDRAGLELDFQGWGSTHAMFKQAIEAVKPRLIVEVGTWKGASTRHMLDLCRGLGLKTEIICVDTWLGSNTVLWLDPECREWLRLKNGYPSMFSQFVHNMIETGLMDSVFPLPMTSSAAYHLLRKFGLAPQMVYVDAGHERIDVYADLSLYFDLLEPGGVLLGDDYAPAQPGVVEAANQFAFENKLLMTAYKGKFMLTKPRQRAAAV
jgi:predicted O-methyltransferase YrrM